MASRVCLACKLRKKKCDKRMPRCSFCNSKNINCRYAYDETSSDPHRRIQSSRGDSYTSLRFSARKGRLTHKQRISHYYGPQRLPVVPHNEGPVDLGEPATLPSQLSLEALRIIRETHPTIQDIGVRYFNGIHTWIPFFCSSRFQEILAQFESSPTSELSLLLLCMSLVTYDPTQFQSPPIEYGTIYLHAKMLFTREQVLQPPSLHLVHAAIFISIYEYACRRLDQALSTIDICARMAYRLGLHLSKSQLEWNTWWAIRIFERIFYCEVPWTNPPMVTSAPDESDILPSEVVSPHESHERPLICLIIPANLAEASCLGRAALATYLLDRVIQTVKDPAATTPVSTLINWDVQLQKLLAATIDKCHGRCEGHCGAVGICIRALFLLHAHFFHIESKNTMFRCREHSEAAIHTAAQMVLDIARSQQRYNMADGDYVPPIFGYLFRYTLKHLYEKRYEINTEWDPDSGILRQGLSKLNRRWSMEAELAL